jgi:hypothetical protein
MIGGEIMSYVVYVLKIIKLVLEIVEKFMKARKK